MRNMKTAFLLTLLVAPVFAGNATNYTYLALGDSVSFGYVPNVTAPTPSSYTGYPEVVAGALRILQANKEENASCPGQTSGSFLIGGADNGCQGFKDTIGLHTTYAGTQANFAVSQLLSNKHIDLVTLSIGGNDLLLVQEACANAPSFPACVTAALPGVFQTYGANLAEILGAIRSQAGYTGRLVLVNLFRPQQRPPVHSGHRRPESGDGSRSIPVRRQNRRRLHGLPSRLRSLSRRPLRSRPARAPHRDHLRRPSLQRLARTS